MLFRLLPLRFGPGSSPRRGGGPGVLRWLAVGALLLSSVLRPAGAGAAPGGETLAPHLSKKEKEQQQNRAARERFFSMADPIPTLHLDLEPREWEYLKKDPRRYAEATLWDDAGSRLWKGVAVKCKGSAGSFQPPEQRPGLSLSMSKYKGADPWRGFERWQLNNGQQDATLLQELISCEVARAAGVPASRCGHAFVVWQGRDLGAFVFKEAFDADFLETFLGESKGDLYDGGFLQEVNEKLEKDHGDPARRENLKELVAAAQEPDLPKRWARLEKILEVDRFLSFLAVESLVCHWDGYDFNKNNYRIYFSTRTGKAIFFLHGSDQTFGDSVSLAAREPSSLIGRAVLSNPEWKKAYRARAEQIFHEVLQARDWPARVMEVGKRLSAALAPRSPEKAARCEARTAEVRNRVAARIAALEKQFAPAPPFDRERFARIGQEEWRREGAGAEWDVLEHAGQPSFYLRAETDSGASWRLPVLLPAGRYRLEGKVTTAGLEAFSGTGGTGAGLRISGSARTKDNSAAGDTEGKELSFTFETAGGEVTLVAEIQARRGEAWFERGSLRLLPVP